MDYRIVDRMFGAYVIEAFEDDELRKYVDGAQRKAGQSRAFVDYEDLAKKLEKNPERQQMIQIARRCPGS
jgi:hypothetical protein